MIMMTTMMMISLHNDQGPKGTNQEVAFHYIILFICLLETNSKS